MKKLLLAALLVLVYSCNNDDEDPYDPIAQLQTDLNLIDAHLSNNGQSVIIHPSGVRYSIDAIGQGDYPVSGDSVATQYDIYTLEGRLIDTTNEDLARANSIFSASRNYDSFEYEFGRGHVIEGFDIGTGLLNEGGEGTFYVPSTLAYRNSGALGLEPNLIFRIKIKVERIY